MAADTAALRGAVALVTGGGRGIGRTLALGLARAGADVAVLSRTEPELRSTAEEIRACGRRAVALVADVRVEGAVRAAVERCASTLGPPGILVNAAALQGPIGRFDAVDLGAWKRTLEVNVLGVAYATAAVLRHMVPAGRGKVLNVSGGGAARPRPRFTAYAASKAALVRFTETLAEELREHNIQVNALAPGATRTRMTREVLDAGAAAGEEASAEARAVWEGRSADPEKQVALAVFLAGPESDHLTGRLIHVNDPWPSFRRAAPADHLYTLRRVEPAAAEAPA